MTVKLFDFEHPSHGFYSVWFDTENKTYGITKTNQSCWCAYSSISELFRVKGM